MSNPQPGYDKREEEEEEEYRPWYIDPENLHPFKLVRKINVGLVLFWSSTASRQNDIDPLIS